MFKEEHKHLLFSSDRRVKTLALCNDKKIDFWHFYKMPESIRFSPPSTTSRPKINNQSNRIYEAKDVYSSINFLEEIN